MGRFYWTSTLVTESLTRAQVLAAWREGQLGRDKPDSSQPWVRTVAPLIGISSITGLAFAIPAGFIYDQASVPIPARLVVSPTGRHIRRAACLHDWRCPWPGNAPNPADGECLTPQEAADELRDGMLADGAASWRANLVRWAVATFGPTWTIQAAPTE